MIHERVAVVAMIEVDDDLCIYTVTHTKGEYYTCTIPREKGMKIIRGIVLHSYTMCTRQRSGILVSVGCRVWVKVRGQMDKKVKSTTPI